MSIEGQEWPTKAFENIQVKHRWQFERNAELSNKTNLRYYIDETKSQLCEDEIHGLIDLSLHYSVQEILFNDGSFKVSDLLKEITSK